MRRRPHGWLPPGPVPPGSGGDPALMPGAGETLDCLCGHWRIFQLRKGHRYSTDDLLTAWYAASECERREAEPRALLELGCGIGSVGLMLLWKFPALRMIGMEAQAQSAALARRSLRFNGAVDRAEILEGDLRALDLPGRTFDLVVGSPPYLDHREGRRSPLPQRGPCRFEDRGGVGDYLRAAARFLAPGGRTVWVHASRYEAENLGAAREAGFGSVRRRPVVFREGKPGLVTLFAASADGFRDGVEPPLVIRNAEGRFSEEFRLVRRAMGFPA